MGLYIWSLLLGVVGLAAMAASGLSHGHSDGGHGAHGGHGHGGHGHAGNGHGHAGHSHAGHSHHAHDGHDGHGHHQEHGAGAKSIWALMSPRFLFSLALGFGATGELLRPVLGGIPLTLVAVLGAIAFERVLVSPLWNFTMRFASTPATTLEGAVADEATAVTAFDANGQGIVSVELDGQVVQILATLQPNDRLLGTRVRAGQRVRIEDVDPAKNCCTVSLL
jgi:hypothetical protein